MNFDEAAYNKRITDLTINEHFQVLGFGRSDNGVYLLMHKRTRKILTLKARQFSVARLLYLAPMHWWTAHFPTKRNAKHSFDKRYAVDFVFRAAERAGEFDDISSGEAM